MQTVFDYSCQTTRTVSGFTEDVEIPVADKEKSVEDIQAVGFAEDEIREKVLA